MIKSQYGLASEYHNKKKDACDALLFQTFNMNFISRAALTHFTSNTSFVSKLSSDTHKLCPNTGAVSSRMHFM